MNHYYSTFLECMHLSLLFAEKLPGTERNSHYSQIVTMLHLLFEKYISSEYASQLILNGKIMINTEQSSRILPLHQQRGKDLLAQ